MPNICPLCARSGIRKMIKPIQVNFDEAVWMCESEECIWPIGYEDLKFISRQVTKTHSNCNKYTTDISKSKKECIPLSTELSLYTPPVTPNGEAIAKESVTCDNSLYSATDSNLSTEISKINGCESLNNEHSGKDFYLTKNCTVEFEPPNATSNSDESANSLPNCSSNLDERGDSGEFKIAGNTDEKVSTTYRSIFNSSDDEYADANEAISAFCSAAKNAVCLTSGDAKNDTADSDAVVSIKNSDTETPSNTTVVTKDFICRSAQSTIAEDKCATGSCSDKLRDENSRSTASVDSSSCKTNGEQVAVKNVQSKRSVKEMPKVVRVEKTCFNINSWDDNSIGSKRFKSASDSQPNCVEINCGDRINAPTLVLEKIPVKLLSPSSQEVRESHLPESISKDVDIISRNANGEDQKISSPSKCTISNISERESSKNTGVQITTMEIDGLPPITLKYELPTILNEVTDAPNDSLPRIDFGGHKVLPKIVSKPFASSDSRAVKQTLANNAKRKLFIAKQYEKFSFNALRNKLKLPQNDKDEISSVISNESPTDVSLRNNKSQESNKDGVDNRTQFCASGQFTDYSWRSKKKVTSNESSASCKNVPPAELNVHAVCNSTTIPAVNVSPDKNSVLNSSGNLDVYLDRLIADECHNVSQNIDDDWLDYLLN